MTNPPDFYQRLLSRPLGSSSIPSDLARMYTKVINYAHSPTVYCTVHTRGTLRFVRLAVECRVICARQLHHPKGIARLPCNLAFATLPLRRIHVDTMTGRRLHVVGNLKMDDGRGAPLRIDTPSDTITTQALSGSVYGQCVGHEGCGSLCQDWACFALAWVLSFADARRQHKYSMCPRCMCVADFAVMALKTIYNNLHKYKKPYDPSDD